MAQNEMSRKVELNECRKLYVQRDYSHGLTVAFSTDFPEGLENKIEKDVWIKFINELNQIYADAESVSSASITECMFGFLTCYLSRLCLKSVWEKHLNEVSEFLNEVNNLSFIKRGVYICDPIEKGLRVIEIVLIDEPSPLLNSQQQQQQQSTPNSNVMLRPR